LRTAPSNFRRLAVTHAAMIGGDAVMLVALADSLFFSIDPRDARGKVLLFLLVSFAPFVVLSPLIGPAIDRMAGGRRLVIQIDALARVLVSLLIARFIDDVLLFPLVFAALVLQKAYIVSKSALVPSVVRTDEEFVEANSKLGLIAGITGFIAVVPALLLQAATGSPVPTLVYSAILFAFGFVAATRLAADRVAVAAPRPVEQVELHGSRLQLASMAMVILRACVGFMFFHLAFLLRDEDAGVALFGVGVALSALGTMAGNAIAPRVRRVVAEETMLLFSLGLVTVAGVLATLMGGVAAGIALAVVANFAASLGRLGFESMVQREAPSANHGRAFATFETKFQFSWVVAGVIPVILRLPAAVGYVMVALAAAVGLLNFFAAARSLPLPRPTQAARAAIQRRLRRPDRLPPPGPPRDPQRLAPPPPPRRPD
jgi:hypothetical protein